SARRFGRERESQSVGLRQCPDGLRGQERSGFQWLRERSGSYGLGKIDGEKGIIVVERGPAMQPADPGQHIVGQRFTAAVPEKERNKILVKVEHGAVGAFDFVGPVTIGKKPAVFRNGGGGT